MTKWKPEDYDPEPEEWPVDEDVLPPEELEDWDLAPVRERLTRLACGE